eukprot:3283881-Lingulodinium_polyedra.AAC.1
MFEVTQSLLKAPRDDRVVLARDQPVAVCGAALATRLLSQLKHLVEQAHRFYPRLLQWHDVAATLKR